MIYLLMLVSILIGYVPVMYPSFAWEASLLSREIIIVTMSFVAVYLCSWRAVKIKCALLINLAYQSTCLLSSVWALYLYVHGVDQLSAYWSLLTVAFFSSWVIYQCMRNFRATGDSLDSEHYFYGLYMPKGFNGIIQSLFSCLYGGVCVYCNGEVWRFRRGELVRCSYRYISNKDIVWINTHVKKDTHFDNELNSLVGAKWRWYKNCFHRLQIFQPIKKTL